MSQIEQGKDVATGDASSGMPPEEVDTKHQDEAMRVLAAYEGDPEWTEEEEKKLRRKLDWKLMPVLCVTYGLQYYDKAMLSQAVRHPCILLHIQTEDGASLTPPRRDRHSSASGRT